eukprot:11206853-Lingulodinium_polyedra.AAC.1
MVAQTEHPQAVAWGRSQDLFQSKRHKRPAEPPSPGALRAGGARGTQRLHTGAGAVRGPRAQPRAVAG